jgi:hypothetical protein
VIEEDHVLLREGIARLLGQVARGNGQRLHLPPGSHEAARVAPLFDSDPVSRCAVVRGELG